MKLLFLFQFLPDVIDIEQWHTSIELFPEKLPIICILSFYFFN